MERIKKLWPLKLNSGAEINKLLVQNIILLLREDLRNNLRDWIMRNIKNYDFTLGEFKRMKKYIKLLLHPFAHVASTRHHHDALSAGASGLLTHRDR